MAEASLGGRRLALVPDQLAQLVTLPLSAQVPRCRRAQSPPEDFERMAAIAHPEDLIGYNLASNLVASDNPV